MITHQREYNAEKLAGYGDQGLFFQHSVLKVSLIAFMKNAAFTHDIQRREEQKLSQKRTASLGYPPVSVVFAGTDFKQIQTGQLCNFGNGHEPVKISHFPDNAAYGNRPDPFDRKDKTAIGDLFKMQGNFFLQFGNKGVTRLNALLNIPGLQKKAFPTLAKSHRSPGSLIKRFGPVFFDLPPAHFPHGLNQGLKAIRFRATKDPNQGTGLGLPMLHSIIEKHGGTIRLESGQGRGAQFIITLRREGPEKDSPS